MTHFEHLIALCPDCPEESHTAAACPYKRPFDPGTLSPEMRLLGSYMYMPLIRTLKNQHELFSLLQVK